MRTPLHVAIFLTLLAPISLCLCQDTRLTPYAPLRTAAEEEITALAFSSNGKLLLSGDDDGNIACWDIEKKRVIAEVKVQQTAVFLGFLSGDRSYVAVDGGGNILVIDILKGATEVTFRTKAKPLRSALDAGRQYLAIATKDERIEIYDLKALMPAGTIDAGDKISDILFLGFDRLGTQIVAITQLGDVAAWNLSTLKPLRGMALAGGELHGSQSVVHAAASNRAANIFAVDLEEVALPAGGIMSGRDLERREAIVAYDWASGSEVKRTKTGGPVRAMALGPGNDHVAVVYQEEKRISLVDLRKGELGSSVTLENDFRVLTVSDNDQWLAAGSTKGHILLWKLSFKAAADVRTAATPSLGGRIRTRSGTEPALKRGVTATLALLTFEAKGVSQEVADVCLNSLANTLANVDYVTLVERRQIENIIKEQRLQVSGLTEEQGVKVGRLLNADHVLIGSIGKLGTSMVFTARIISVETGRVVAGREVLCEECRDQDIYDAISMLASTIAQQ